MTGPLGGTARRPGTGERGRGRSIRRAISEVGASLMVGGNIAGLTRVLTTATVLEAGRGEFAQAIALSIILLALAFLVNTALIWSQRATA